MKDKIILMNVSEMPNSLVETALQGINEIRPLEITPAEAGVFLEKQIALAYNSKRRQVDGEKLLGGIHNSGIGRHVQPGKIIIINEDLYSGAADGWNFGGYVSTSYGLGYILMSSARARTPELATDILRHELGHMFGAPSEGRNNTYSNLGLHCSNDLCVMQQKDNMRDAINYTSQRARLNARPYCSQCEQDIKEKIVRE